MIRSKATEKKYIGKSVNIKKRTSQHLWLLKKIKHDNIYLQEHFNKHGIEDLDITVLELCKKEDLSLREQYHINKKSPEFNIHRIVYNLKNIRRKQRAAIKKERDKKNKYPIKKKKHMIKRKTRLEDFPEEILSDDTREILRKIRLKKKNKIAK